MGTRLRGARKPRNEAASPRVHPRSCPDSTRCPRRTGARALASRTRLGPRPIAVVPPRSWRGTAPAPRHRTGPVVSARTTRVQGTGARRRGRTASCTRARVRDPATRSPA